MAGYNEYMAEALRLAELGRYTTQPNPHVGCVIVKNNQIIGRGWHQRAGEAHAEIHALHAAGEAARGADCYVTLEPCSHTGRTGPCADALITAGVKRVFVAMTDPNPLVAGRGMQKLRDAGITVESGLLAADAEKLNRGFIKRMRHGRPYVRSKIAMSLDGRTAMASGESQWITGPDARQDVHRMRAASGAILTGIGTVMADDPQLNVRPEGDWYPPDTAIRQPWVVVADSQARLSPQAGLRQSDKLIWVVANTDSSALPDLDHWVLPGADQRVDLQALMTKLAEEAVSDVMVEAGAILNGALLQAGLIDELVFYVAGRIIGDAGRGAFHIPSVSQLADTTALEIVDTRQVGADWRVTARPCYQQEH